MLEDEQNDSNPKQDEGNKSTYMIPPKIAYYDTNLNAVGMDFGTTECCAAVIRKYGPDFVVLGSTSERTMPSYVAFDEKEPKCGQIVIDRMRHKSEYSVFDIKRIIGKSIEQISIDPFWPFKIIKNKEENVLIEVETFNGKETKSPEEISAVLLSRMKMIIQEYQKSKLLDAAIVITIPAKFSDQQKNSLKTAAKISRWNNIHFLPEPVAAAFTYFTEKYILNNSNILICDFGGGTVDICVAKVSNEELKILNFDGDLYLGGRDFDNILYTHFHAVLRQKFGIDVTKTRKKYVLNKKCQEIKHTLSAADVNEHWLDVDDFDNDSDKIIKITKEEFEDISLPLIVRIKDVILRTVSHSNLQKNDINYVFQVGGGCRMPMIKKLLFGIFPESNHQCYLYPDWAVAHGAALYAYYLQTHNTQK
uniref:Heat shock protein 70 n=1 Tax=Panagrolaimus sp. ES5 TaxID=591445 RepID=A0AC34GV27_9BILA